MQTAMPHGTAFPCSYSIYKIIDMWLILTQMLFFTESRKTYSGYAHKTKTSISAMTGVWIGSIRDFSLWKTHHTRTSSWKRGPTTKSFIKVTKIHLFGTKVRSMIYTIPILRVSKKRASCTITDSCNISDLMKSSIQDRIFFMQREKLETID